MATSADHESTKCRRCYAEIPPDTPDSEYTWCEHCYGYVHGKCLVENGLLCGCNETPYGVCHKCGTSGTEEMPCVACSNCDSFTCTRCLPVCKCGTTVKLPPVRECEAMYCRSAPGAEVATMCPSCRRWFHDACVQPCRWCRFAGGTECPCRNHVFPNRQPNQSLMLKFRMLLTPATACKHGPTDTEYAFAQRYANPVPYVLAAILVVLIVGAWQYQRGLRTSKEADTGDTLCMLFLAVGLAASMYARWHKQYVEAPRVWRRMQETDNKSV